MLAPAKNRKGSDPTPRAPGVTPGALTRKKIVDFYDRHNLGIKINDTTVSWDWDEWEE